MKIFLLLPLICTLGCSTVKRSSVPSDSDQLLKDIKTLSSDSYEGRKTGTKGGELAKNYIAKRFKEIGIKSFPLMNSYQQAFTFAGIDNPKITGHNLIGYIPGTSEKIIVVSAHYDHLGGMGKDTYFPGANDNASGVSQLLSLAKYFAAHPHRYSMVFIGFSGEEAGILGSKYFSEHPLIPLSNIRFLVNLDLNGTGDEGMMVVNATIHPKEFNLLQQLNNLHHYFVKIGSRGKAANSDHYWFTQLGVPAFYMYTLGGIKAYHDVFDISKTLPLNKYNSLFKLLVGFSEGLMK